MAPPMHGDEPVVKVPSPEQKLIAGRILTVLLTTKTLQSKNLSQIKSPMLDKIMAQPESPLGRWARVPSSTLSPCCPTGD